MHNEDDVNADVGEKKTERKISYTKVNAEEMDALIKHSKSITAYNLEDKEVILLTGNSNSAKNDFIKIILGEDFKGQNSNDELNATTLVTNCGADNANGFDLRYKYPRIYSTDSQLYYCDIPYIDKNATRTERVWGGYKFRNSFKECKKYSPIICYR